MLFLAMFQVDAIFAQGRQISADPGLSEYYPNLIASGETIETPQMAAVLAVYDLQPGSPRYENRFGNERGSSRYIPNSTPN